MNHKNPQPVYLKDYQAPPYFIDKVDLEFILTEAYTTVNTTLTVYRNPNSSIHNNTLMLSGESLELFSVSLDGRILHDKEYQMDDHGLQIFNVPDECIIDTTVKIKPQENTALSGLYKSSGNFCTQCESHGFRRITYFLDRPDVMATYTTTIIADEMQYPVLLSNGNLIATGKLDNGKHWAKWQDPFKKPSYLFALVAGDLECVEDYFITQSGRKVILRIYVEKGNQDKCAHAMQAVKKCMRWDEEKYGREYDLDIYMIVAVSDFNMGAMENKGLNIFNTKYILAKSDTATDLDYIHVESVIAHEYFHNWTGNRITCRDWFQLSLKEGLTIFRDQGFTMDTTSRAVARIMEVNSLRNTQFPEDAGPLSHPVRPDSYIEINNFYTATVYNKGSEVIRMLQTIIGENDFSKGMDLYFERHDGQAVTIEDFVKAHEDASGKDLTQFRLWYSQSGTPTLEITDHYDNSHQKYSLKIVQKNHPTADQKEKLPMHIPVKMGLLDQSGKEIVAETLHVVKHENTFEFDHIHEKPIPSLLRFFSAPVKMQYQYTDDELALLMTSDTDLFNRWEAGQQYATKIILRLVQDVQQKKALVISDHFISTYRNLMMATQDDKWFLSEMLTLPTEKYLAEQMVVVDVDAIHSAREFVLKEMARQLKNIFAELYQQHHHTTHAYQFTMLDVASRSLKNICLWYLMHLSDKNIAKEYAIPQFDAALRYNMTDAMAALKALANSEDDERVAVLNTFYQQYRQNALVIDKWLAIQASAKLSNTFETVKELMQHEAFDIKNPNKVYALIGSFGNNSVRFHAKDGEGYRFLTEIILQLDALNPQVAARMLKPFTEWKRFDKDRQKLMHEQLTQLERHSTLSKDVYELVNKSLGATK